MTKLLLAFLLLVVACHARTISVSDHGAVGDGTTLNTHALQQAIDACHASGGGKVVFSAGNYVTGTLFLKSNVILHLEAGATLAGSTNFKDYAPNVFRNQYADRNKKEGCLIFAENAANIGIEEREKSTDAAIAAISRIRTIPKKTGPCYSVSCAARTSRWKTSSSSIRPAGRSR